MTCAIAAIAAPAPEGLDFASTLQARTYAPGLSLNSTVGYGQSIWGDTESPWYGFVRPHATGVVSPTLSEAQIALEVFPISIVGINLARTISRRFVDTRGQDCAAVQCQGRLDYTDFTLQGFLGGGGYFSSLRWTRTFFDAISDSTRPIFDPATSVLLQPSGEAGDYTTIIIGKKLSDELSIGLLVQNADFKFSGQHQEGQYLIINSELNNFGYDGVVATIGLGRFKSDLNVAEVSAILSVKYTQWPAIGLGR